ncbi:unnamed protein product, partial [Effrenium voratum]
DNLMFLSAFVAQVLRCSLSSKLCRSRSLSWRRSKTILCWHRLSCAPAVQLLHLAWRCTSWACRAWAARCASCPSLWRSPCRRCSAWCSLAWASRPAARWTSCASGTRTPSRECSSASAQGTAAK